LSAARFGVIFPFTQREKGTRMKGHCICGAVEITVPDIQEAAVCHCGTCQRWGGGPLFTLDHDGQLEIRGQDHITAYASSDWAERAFCKTCGSHLYYHLKGHDHYALSAGLFQQTPEVSLSQQIFIDEKPDYYDLSNDTPKLTGAEAFAAFQAANGESD
jgi:hypothetical protein